MKAVIVWCCLCAGLLLAALFVKSAITNGILATAFLVLTGGGMVFICIKR